MNSQPATYAVLIFAWNGVVIPFQFIAFDAAPQFQIILFNYSGNEALPPVSDSYRYDALLSLRTEFKGSLLNATYQHLKDNHQIDYIGFVDDDIETSIGAMNTLLTTARAHRLDAFQASIHPDSFYSHSFNVHQPGKEIAYVNWIEIMMPFYRKNLFDAAHDFYATNISSYGIDNYAIPFYQQILSLNKTAVIHSVMIKHLKPVTDGSKIFSNGLTARQEGERVRAKVLQLIRRQYPTHFSKQFLCEVYELNSFRFQSLKYRLKDFLRL